MKNPLFLLILSCTITTGLIYSIYLHLFKNFHFAWNKLSNDDKLLFFHNENALYFSYYFDFIQSSSISDGFRKLIWNNVTEYPNEINVLKRMNVWQDVIIGFNFKILILIFPHISPIEFYYLSVIVLQSVITGSIFILASSLNKSISAGFLSFVFCMINRHKLSTTIYSVSSRENFAMPLFWIRVVLWHFLIRPKKQNFTTEKLIKKLYVVSTCLFCLFWQISPFIILIESVIMFFVESLEYIPNSLALFYNLTNLFALLASCICQFGNFVLLSSFSLTFILASLLMSCFKSPKMVNSSFSGRLTWISVQATCRFIFALLFRLILQVIFKQKDDSHIFRFIAAKFGIGNPRDFHVNMYLCNHAYDWMPIDNYLDSFTMITYPYLIVNFGVGLAIIISSLCILWHDTEEEEEMHPTVRQCVIGAEGDYCGGCGHLLSNRSELVYHYGMTTSLLLLAMTVQQMQYTVAPYIILFSTMIFCDYRTHQQILVTFLYVMEILFGQFLSGNISSNSVGVIIRGDTNTSLSSMQESEDDDEDEDDFEVHEIGQPTQTISTEDYSILEDNNQPHQHHQLHHLQFNQIETVETPISTTFNTKYNVNVNPLQKYNRAIKSLDLFRNVFVITLIIVLSLKILIEINDEFNNQNYVHDKDTVELTNWIKNSTASDAVFAGTMQLLATIKLTTGRPITTHPHYDDYDLRFKTKKIYQIYARQSEEYIYLLMRYYDIDYFVIEDKLCLAPSNGCQIKDLLDLDNGHMPETSTFMHFRLKYVAQQRFCQAIRHIQYDNSTIYSNFFRFRFSNLNYRVYEVL